MSLAYGARVRLAWAPSVRAQSRGGFYRVLNRLDRVFSPAWVLGDVSRNVHPQSRRWKREFSWWRSVTGGRSVKLPSGPLALPLKPTMRRWSRFGWIGVNNHLGGLLVKAVVMSLLRCPVE